MKKLKLLSLEPRVLLDAAAATTAADTQTDVNEQSEAYEQSQQDFTNQQDNTESDISALALPSTTQTEATTKHWDLINAEEAGLNQVQAHQMVVVDTSIQNYQTLLEK